MHDFPLTTISPTGRVAGRVEGPVLEVVGDGSTGFPPWRFVPRNRDQHTNRFDYFHPASIGRFQLGQDQIIFLVRPVDWKVPRPFAALGGVAVVGC
jgi:hypothetical protein